MAASPPATRVERSATAVPGGRSRLRIALVAALAVVNTATIYLAYDSIEEGRRAAYERSRSQTQNLALLVERDVTSTLDRTEAGLVVVAERLREQILRDGVDRAALASLTESMKKRVTVAGHVEAFDAKGQMICRPNARCLDIDVSDRPYFHWHRDHGTTTTQLTGPMRIRIDNEWALVLSQRLSARDGTFAGMVAASVPLATIKALFEKLDLGPDGAVTLRTADLAQVVRHPGPMRSDDEQLNRKVSPAILDAIARQPLAGTYLARTALDGVERQDTYRRFDHHPLYVIVGQSTEDFLSPWRERRDEVFAFTAAFIASSWILAWLILRTIRSQETSSRRVSGLLDRLTRIASQVPGAVVQLQRATDREILVTYSSSDMGAHLGVGMTRGEALARLRDCVHPEDWPQVDAALQRSADALSPYRQDFRMRDEEGRSRWVRAHATPYAEHGTVLWNGYFGEVTDEKAAVEALKASERRFRDLFERHGAVMLLVDSGTGTIVAANRAAERFYGYPREQLCRLRIDEVNALPPDKIRDELRCAATGSRSYFVFPHRLANGQVRTVEVHSSPITDTRSADGKLLFSIIHDITERTRVELELRKLSRAVEQSPASIVITDREGRIEYVNPCFEATTGYARSEVVGQNPRVLKSGQTPLATYEALWSAIANGREWRGELCNRRKDGELFWEYAAISGMQDAAGEVTNFIAVKYNITAQKRADALLRESEQLFATVFHASPVGIAIFRLADAALTEVNEAALRMWEVGRGEIMGRTAQEIGLRTEAGPDGFVLDAMRREAGRDRFDLSIRTPGGSTRTLSVSVRPVTLRSAECLIAMMVDVTDSRLIEEARLRTQNLASLGTLAGGIAHDFNNILSAIRGNAALALQEVGEGHAARVSLAEIVKAGERASDLVRRITTFARPVAPSRKVVELPEVVREVLQLLRATVPAGIELRTRFGGGTRQVLADGAQVHEAVVNLTTNAAHAIGGRSGWIEYRLREVVVDAAEAARMNVRPGAFLRLEVADSGCGMEKGTMERIFDAFYTTKAVGEGTGLGLSMVYGIMRAHSGGISVDSEPGHGTVFRLFFPVEGALEPYTPAPALPAARQTPRKSGIRTLYVDDEEPLVFLATRALGRLGYRVTGYCDPKKALEAFRSGPADFDAVVTDMSMPQMSGLDFARELAVIRPGIPIVMTTGYIRAGDPAAAREAGIRVLLAKPSTVEELASVLDEVLQA